MVRLTQDHPTYARLHEDVVVEAEPAAVLSSATAPREPMRVKNFSKYENGALVRGEDWELVVEDKEIEALLKGS